MSLCRKGVGAGVLCKSEDGSDLLLPDDSQVSPFVSPCESLPGVANTLGGSRRSAPPHADPPLHTVRTHQLPFATRKPPPSGEAFRSLTPSCQLLYSAN